MPTDGERGTAHLVGHQALDHGGVESGVNMAPKDGRGHVKPTPDFALCEAMHVLREVVREPTPLVRLVRALHQRRPGDDAKAQQEGTHERRDERGGGAQAGLVHIADWNAGGQEFGELAKRGRRGGESARLELFTL